MIARLLAGGVLVGVAFVLPPSDQSTYMLAGMYGIAAIGLSLVMGLAGQVSLGQGAFVAIGAYAAGLLSVHGVAPWLALALAPVITALIGLVLAVPLLRLRGHYLAFGTLAVHIVVLTLITSWQGLTGGELGLGGIPELTIGGTVLSPTALTVFTWLAALAAVAAIANIMNSRPGRALRALATDEQAAGASAIEVYKYKVQVFVAAAALAGFGGGLYAFAFSYLAPGSFPLLLSVELVVMVAVGGLAAPGGALLGAVTVTFLLEGVQTIGTLPGMPTTAPTVFAAVFYGLVLAVTMLLMPRGIVPELAGLVRRFRSENRTPRVRIGGPLRDGEDG